jgi:hypothetical protein
MRTRPLPFLLLLTAVDCAAQTNPLAKPGTIFDAILLLAFGAGFSALFLIPAYKAWKWQDDWRWTALLPAAVMGFVVLRLVVDTYRDATSHNLWPFEIVMFGLGSLLFMGAVTLLRRFIG